MHPARAAGPLLAALGDVLLLSSVTQCVAQAVERWPIHSLERPRPPIVDPGPTQPPAPPPSDAIMLFEGRDLSRWRSADGGPARWKVENGYVGVVPGTGAIATAEAFGDV